MTPNTQKLLLAAVGVSAVGLLIVVSTSATAAPPGAAQGGPPLPPGPKPSGSNGGQTGPGTFTKTDLTVSKKGGQVNEPDFNPIPQVLIPQIPDGTPHYLGDPSTLQQGQRYRAKLELSGFETMASASMIADQFQKLGFSNIAVYMSASDLPPDWPKLTTLNAGPNSRFIEANWNSATKTIPRPPQIQLAWPA